MIASIYALTMKENIAVTNIVYASRSVMIIPMVFLVDKFIQEKIDGMTKKTFSIRLIGSIVLLSCIVFSLLNQ